MSTSTDVKETELNREELHDAHPDIMESIQVACKQQSLNALEHIETAVTHRLTKLKSTGPAAMLIMVLLYVIRMMTFSIARREDEASRLLDDKAALLRDVTTLEKQVADLKKQLAEEQADFTDLSRYRISQYRFLIEETVRRKVRYEIMAAHPDLYQGLNDVETPTVNQNMLEENYIAPILEIMGKVFSYSKHDIIANVAAEATPPQDEDVDYIDITSDELDSLRTAIASSQGASTDDGLDNLFDDTGIDFPDDNPDTDAEGFYAGKSLHDFIDWELGREADEYHQNGDSDPSKTVTAESPAIDLDAHKAETVETTAVSAQEFIDAMPAEPPSS